MKNMIKLPAIILGLLLLITGATQKVMAQGEDVSMQSFYDELSPYGTWIQDPQYGYVWRPDVEQGDFRPYYTNGRWAMTEYGNTWVSNYDWGWAPFHYGRWVFNRYSQWVWIPDTTWGPAWVSWRTGGGYYGWAPMGPGMNINVNFNIPDLWWVFIPQRNIYYDSFPRYYSRRNVVIINNTTIINNTYVNNRRTYYTGPRADDIRRVTRQDVRVYNVHNMGRPSRSSIDGNNLNIYSPRPSRGASNVTAAPREAIRGDGYTTIRGDRNSTNNGSSARPTRADNPSNRNVDNTPNRNNDRGNTFPSRGDNRTDATTPNRRPGTSNDNNTRPSRTENPVNTGADRPQRTERGTPAAPTSTPVPAPTPTPIRDRETPRPQRAQSAPQQREQRPVETPRPTRQEQPQRQESRPAPQAQPQRSERVQQSAPQSRGSESRGGGGGESGRPTRGGGR